MTAPNPPFDLAGRTALVTGAAGGLGQEMARALAAAGARVVVHHLGQEKEAAALVEELTDAGSIAAAVEGDVSDWDAAGRFVTAAQRAVGPIDVLVNNAGSMEPRRLVEMTLEDWHRTIDVDLTGVFIVSRHVAPSMLDRGRGVIVNVSSQLAYKGAEDYTSYCAAKAGVLGLTKAMARELGPAIRVNAIAPGPIATPMTAGTFTEELTLERTRGAVVRRLGTPQEVAPAVVYLAGEGSTYMHGQTLHLNGGGVMA